jgi:YesN/AraC family two-component response regulator
VKFTIEKDFIFKHSASNHANLGYGDEHYFSRFIKTNSDVSPQLYRETVGFAKAEA